jgi:hypothetical protein
MHLEHAAEIGEIHLGEGLVAEDAGIVDQDIHPSPSGENAIDHVLNGALIGHIGGERNRLSPGGELRRPSSIPECHAGIIPRRANQH